VNAGIKGREERGATNGRGARRRAWHTMEMTRVGKEARMGEEKGVWLSGCWADEESGWVGTIRCWLARI